MEYLGAWKTLIHEKNLKSKISCQTPFKVQLFRITFPRQLTKWFSFSECITWTWNTFICAGIFKQSIGARNRVGLGLSYRYARLHTTQPCGIGSLQSILGLLKSLKIRTKLSRSRNKKPTISKPAIESCYVISCVQNSELSHIFFDCRSDQRWFFLFYPTFEFYHGVLNPL